MSNNMNLNNRGHKFVLNGNEYLVSGSYNNEYRLVSKTVTENGTYNAIDDPTIQTESISNFTITSGDYDPGKWLKISGLQQPIDDLRFLSSVSLHLKVPGTTLDDDFTINAPIQRFEGGDPYDYTPNIWRFSLSVYALIAIDGNDIYFGVGRGEYQFTNVVLTAEYPINGYSGFNVMVEREGGKIEYLCHSHCDVDDGTVNTNRAMTLDTFDNYSDYLEYDTTNKKLVVKKDFEGILVPWIVNYQRGTHEAHGGVRLNSDWLCLLKTPSNAVGTVGSIINSYVYGNSTLPSLANALYVSLKEGDTLDFRKELDWGWAEFHLKIYKLFIGNDDTDEFMQTVTTLDNTSLHKSQIIY